MYCVPRLFCHLYEVDYLFVSLTSFFSDQGQPTETIAVKQKKRPQIETPNLLSPHVMESGSLSLRGWWMSHVKWDVTEMKQRSKQKHKQVSQALNYCLYYTRRHILAIRLFRTNRPYTKARLSANLFSCAN